MATVTETRPSLRRRGVFSGMFVDRAFRWSTLAFAVSVPLLIIVLAWVLARTTVPAFQKFGWSFLTNSIWDSVHEHFGILFAIYGTAVTSLLALLIAVPISLGAALFLAELAPRWMREPLSFMIELLAAVPSIVYGLWGIFVLVPPLRQLEIWLGMHLGFIPLFQGPAYGLGVLAAGVVLAIMILPYITSVSREVIQAVPRTQKEAALALGATRWEALRGPVLRYARAGIFGAVVLGLGRALGETMAVTMLIGNSTKLPTSLFDMGSTMPSLLANEFNEAIPHTLKESSLVAVALVLVLVTIVINGIARLLIWSVSRGSRLEVRE